MIPGTDVNAATAMDAGGVNKHIGCVTHHAGEVIKLLDHKHEKLYFTTAY